MVKYVDGDFMLKEIDVVKASPKLGIQDQIETLEKELERIERKIADVCKLSGANRFPPMVQFYKLAVPPVVIYSDNFGNDFVLGKHETEKVTEEESDEDSDWNEFVKLRVRAFKNMYDVDQKKMVEVMHTGKRIKEEVADMGEKAKNEKNDKDKEMKMKEVDILSKITEAKDVTDEAVWDEFVKERVALHNSLGKATKGKRGIKKYFRRIFKRK